MQLFLFDGSDVNLCKDTVVSSLSIGFENGLDSIVQLMLYNGADMHLVEKKVYIPREQWRYCCETIDHSFSFETKCHSKI